MDDRYKAKIERYLKNANRFLWGLPPCRSQKEIYSWLMGKRYEFKKGTYESVINQLLEKYGIEKILKGLIIPEVEKQYNREAIDLLRHHWYEGRVPLYLVVKTYKIENPYPFLEINKQFKYVERWGEFAGLWFEEIEPIKEK